MATNGHAITVSTTETDQSHVASFWARYEHLKMHDVLKNVLLEVRQSRSYIAVNQTRPGVADYASPSLTGRPHAL